jgi:CSLREA domain-containing protein/MYXO-CTERM domain-containing protein
LPRRTGTAALTSVVCLALLRNAALAATFTVNTTSDARDASPGDGVCETAPHNGTCTLRAAIQEANALGGANAISVPSGNYVLTIAGAFEDASATGDLDVNSTMTITGEGASRTIIDGGGAALNDNVFDLHAASAAPDTITIASLTVRNAQRSAVQNRFGIMSTLADLTISDSGVGVMTGGPLTLLDSTISGNNLNAGVYASTGGGVYVAAGSTVIMRDTFVDNGTGSSGGGVYVAPMAAASVTNCTFTGNTATDGGGISASGSLHLNNVTMAGNSATHFGGGIEVFGTVDIANTIIANNTAVSASPDCYMNNNVSMTSYGFNIVRDVSFCSFSNASNNGAGVDPMLGPLSDNGGPTKTMAPLPGSIAIAHGNPNQPGSATNNSCEVTDQRGLPRGSVSNGTICTIGAYDEDGHGPADLAVPNDLSVPLDLALPSDMAAAKDLASQTAADLATSADLAVFILPATDACGCSVGRAATDKPAVLLVAAILALWLRQWRRARRRHH